MPGQNVKKRNWTFLVYPESAPADWVSKLQATGLPVAISPLHDKDINPDGELKKAHYHVIVCYSGPTYNVFGSDTVPWTTDSEASGAKCAACIAISRTWITLKNTSMILQELAV